jgi:4-hydroxy-tetrahydrodipicolinate synthase
VATASEAREWAHSALRDWGGAFKCAASLLGLPVGAYPYPHSRPPQAELPDQAAEQFQDAYRRIGFIDK